MAPLLPCSSQTECLCLIRREEGCCCSPPLLPSNSQRERERVAEVSLSFLLLSTSQIEGASHLNTGEKKKKISSCRPKSSLLLSNSQTEAGEALGILLAPLLSAPSHTKRESHYADDEGTICVFHLLSLPFPSTHREREEEYRKCLLFNSRVEEIFAV